MQFIKNWADELALLGKPVDNEDLIDKILDGLGDEYKGIVDAVNAHETPISFDEIHKKLIKKEASFQLQQSQAPPLSFSATANLVNHRNNQSWRPSSPSWRTSTTTSFPIKDNNIMLLIVIDLHRQGCGT